MEVPTASSLSDIYPQDALPVETKRWESLLAKFKDLYGKQADFVARSPGRVNIIGEVRAELLVDQVRSNSSSTSITPCMRCYRWPSPPTLSWQLPCARPRRSPGYVLRTSTPKSSPPANSRFQRARFQSTLPSMSGQTTSNQALRACQSYCRRSEANSHPWAWTLSATAPYRAEAACRARRLLYAPAR
jgi:hypothetical protein